MPAKPISQFTALTTVADGDLIPIVDVSDTSQSANGTTKKITKSNLIADLASKSETLTNKTLTSPVINTGVSGTAIDTDGTLTANSDTKIASQKAVKTYVDAHGLTLSQVYPIGSIYISTVSTNPATLFGFGTWTAFATGRTLIGVGTSDQAFTAGATGGASNANLAHSHTVASHTHTITNAFTSTYSVQNGNSYTNGGTVANTTQNTGAASPGTDSQLSSTTSLLQPYIVTYMWQRTA